MWNLLAYVRRTVSRWWTMETVKNRHIRVRGGVFYHSLGRIGRSIGWIMVEKRSFFHLFIWYPTSENFNLWNMFFFSKCHGHKQFFNTRLFRGSSTFYPIFSVSVFIRNRFKYTFYNKKNYSIRHYFHYEITTTIQCGRINQLINSFDS